MPNSILERLTNLSNTTSAETVFHHKPKDTSVEPAVHGMSREEAMIFEPRHDLYLIAPWADHSRQPHSDAEVISAKRASHSKNSKHKQPISYSPTDGHDKSSGHRKHKSRKSDAGHHKHHNSSVHSHHHSNSQSSRHGHHQRESSATSRSWQKNDRVDPAMKGYNSGQCVTFLRDVTPEPEPEKRGFWKRLFGKKKGDSRLRNLS
ncbi:hypothetical protein K505DRAFT_395595 [Melanomma pulvis-pyrius CBS 109.77]|uniref:Uncharacterized protein n=1 Tax=Melanomma pulvis-pyrius CBS 109.77 TaxID=1314802 RepID=A0A6A6WV70_9PLEO|nr:hypothetical protein K505DRAFT_395595 [Melanomma pulvis-pyrius CBS 109.77]